MPDLWGLVRGRCVEILSRLRAPQSRFGGDRGNPHASEREEDSHTSAQPHQTPPELHPHPRGQRCTSRRIRAGVVAVEGVAPTVPARRRSHSTPWLTALISEPAPEVLNPYKKAHRNSRPRADPADLQAPDRLLGHQPTPPNWAPTAVQPKRSGVGAWGCTS